MTVTSAAGDSPFAGFEPHPLLWNGHLQTLAAAWLTGRVRLDRAAREHRVPLADGDRLVVHEDCPTAWQPPDPAAVMLHGLCGSAASSYMSRIAGKLIQAGQRTFRVDMRGCGAGHGLAAHPYHAGRSDDLAAVVEFVAGLCPASPIVLVGFSLGGNILLKWLGEQGTNPPQVVTRAVAVNPPVDLQTCTNHLSSFWGGFYDRHFAWLLCRQIRNTPHWRAALPAAWSAGRPRRLVDFDETFTAPRAGFGSAADYYHHSSAARVIDRIAVPTLVLASCDDPVIPVHTLQQQPWPGCVQLHVAPRGGHLGYIARSSGRDPDRHWMDWRVVDWLTAEEESDIGASTRLNI
ncbi:MAG: YheT family hydrolase [Planctomycetaceae bacterium]